MIAIGIIGLVLLTGILLASVANQLETRTVRWKAKFEANVRRDARVRRALNRAGWSVMGVWEHDLRRPEDVGRVVLRVLRRIS